MVKTRASSQMTYCVRCKGKTPSVGSSVRMTKNNRKMMVSKCAKCGTKKCCFV